jgi:uncharacterized LabA/DUF88 family protein
MYNIYVDGESHFLRSEACLKDAKGEGAVLEALTAEDNWQGGYPLTPGARIRVDRKGKFFWDKYFIRPVGSHFHDTRVGRAVYFTSSTGGEGEIHKVRTSIRNHAFEPQVIWERKNLADQRANLLKKEGVIERAKGVDVGLAVRILEDAYANTFQDCLLFTSDLDFLPVIRGIRRMGKQVLVLGYREGLTERSPLLYEPDGFYDLGEHVRREYKLSS